MSVLLRPFGSLKHELIFSTCAFLLSVLLMIAQLALISGEAVTLSEFQTGYQPFFDRLVPIPLFLVAAYRAVVKRWEWQQPLRLGVLLLFVWSVAAFPLIELAAVLAIPYSGPLVRSIWWVLATVLTLSSLHQLPLSGKFRRLMTPLILAAGFALIGQVWYKVHVDEVGTTSDPGLPLVEVGTPLDRSEILNRLDHIVERAQQVRLDAIKKRKDH